ncbi:uncharacterized protein LOC111642901 [Copidosoma floridanum]|uniref:uncharacterized protein LOC106646853 n=1 Tax=Copidosoma floridanum TaxID=29053 RepID=UPI0006C96F0F|nr:uncharacterized protein LOC106646853 [Copidosoma floridanum]XP_023245343.1 uncharacterized protein LOC111642901 [Copidosoma floridanum]
MGGHENQIHNEYGCSDTGGVKAMAIQGRMARERERLIGMTDEERAWRAQWLKDQHLHGEPVEPKNYYVERYNPIRRFYRYPLDKLESALKPLIGTNKAIITRHVIGKGGFLIASIYSTWYYFKYNAGDWTRKGGWKVTYNRIPTYPGDPGYPNFKEKTAQEFATFGFENSPI